MGAPVRLLLINPRFPESFWSFRWALDNVLPGKRAINPPLGLATLAALCPPHWEVTILDENIESLPLHPQADIVGVCGMGVQFQRQREILAYYRNAGYYVVAGGSYASLCPEEYEGLPQTVVAGEAEYVWRKFCADYEAAAPQPLYRETGSVKLEDSPAPRFDLLKLDRYCTSSLQFSRGCPYMCEFCDIIVMFGRRPRAKRPEQIERELDALRLAGVRSVFFVDDNLIGNRKSARELLQFLADYQRRHHYPFCFGTEASLNLAGDEELLRLFREARFGWVFVGIETPDEASLKEAHKTQNLRQDTLTAVRALYENGLDVLAGFIVGFDNDTVATFEKQYRFIIASGIQAAMVGLLVALPKTPLYARLQSEGRLASGAEHSDNTKLRTNVIPKQMSQAQLIEGYRALYQRLFSDAHIAQRIRNKMRYLRDPVCANAYSAADSAHIVWRLLWRGLLRGGPGRLVHFAATLCTASIRAWPLVINDWIAGLAMRDYLLRHFEPDPMKAHRVTLQTARWLLRTWAGGIRLGHLEVTTEIKKGVSHLYVRVAENVERRFYDKSARRLHKLLRDTASTLTLHVEGLHEAQRRSLQQLLALLAPHGDRVTIWLDEHVRSLLTIDSSRFHVALTAPAGGSGA
jgi:radical SAM superfamily enzyme YgiQ (UPF0313 family)